LYLGHNVCKSTTALGFEAGLHPDRVRSRYRGEQYDPDLGLYYLRARYYNPNTGRFLSRDPENGKAKIPATLHKYLYAAGDPVNRIDPKGKDAIVEYALELGEDEATAAELRVTGLVVREELLNACVELAMPLFEAGGVPPPAAYDLALAMCSGILG
jgi:RHS repeat-associated protein